MHAPLLVVAAVALQAMTPAQAATRPGATFQEIKAQYASSEASTTPDRSPVLTLKDIDYDGVRWSSVRFVFGPTRRLRSLTMSTRTVSYETLIAHVRNGAGPPALENTADPIAPSEFQIRICDDGEGLVTLTYEPTTIPV